MHNKYQDSIRVADALGFTMVGWIDGFNYLVLVPEHDWLCTANNCATVAVVFDNINNKFFDGSYCFIDTTPNNDYFRMFDLTKIGKSISCWGNPIRGINSLYVNRAKQSYLTNGIAGRVINGLETNFPVNNNGINTTFLYSDSSTLKYSPI